MSFVIALIGLMHGFGVRRTSFAQARCRTHAEMVRAR
jgi:hypothetical protein